MNTIEKRKLEAVIASELSKAREAYKARRERELNELVKQFEKNPTPQAQKVVTQFETKRRQYCTEQQELQKAIDTSRKEYFADKEEYQNKLEKLGYYLSTDYREETTSVSLKSTTEYTGRYGNTAIRTYSIPQLISHVTTTRADLQKFDDYATEYTVNVWATGEDMAKTLKEFYKGLGQLVA